MARRTAFHGPEDTLRPVAFLYAGGSEPAWRLESEHVSSHPEHTDRVVVLESFGPPHERTNPYSIRLVESFPPRVEMRYFTWRRALLEPFDVFHLHWPEVKVRGTSGPRSLLRGTLFLLLLLRVRLTRRGLVRTLHDSIPHEAPNALQRWVIGLSERWTTLWIVLNDDTPAPPGAVTRRSRIGHFGDWFEPGGTTAVPGRLLHFGLVRRYKGIDTLLREFERIRDPSLSLRIVGLVHEDDLADEMERVSERDPRVTVENAFVSDERLCTEILSSELVVLPFSRITNSSSLLVALSLGRPVLAPEAPSIVEVADEVGDGWVQLYEGELTAAHVLDALDAVRAFDDDARPDLTSRSWTTIGEEHAEAFELARDLAAGRTRR